MSSILTLNGDVLTSGGNVLTVEGGGGAGDYWAWYGTNAVLLETSTQTVALADTDFATWTPSTTGSTIWTKTFSSQTLGNDYRLIAVARFEFKPVYNTGTTVLSGGTYQCSAACSTYASNPSSVAGWGTGSKNQTSTYLSSWYAYFYNNASGVDGFLTTNSYDYRGVYVSGIIPYNYPASIKVSARADSTYFSTAMMEALDQNQSKFTLEASLYKAPVNRIWQQAIIDQCIDMYQNGIS